MADYDLAVLGAGAAGLMAVIAAAEHARAAGRTLRIGLFEKNSRPGIKILVCGGGRCNFTNAGSVEFLIDQFGRNGRFLTSALRHLSNEALRGFFAQHGVPSHEEHDGKIYPDSNQAKSVVDCLVRLAREGGTEMWCGADGTIGALGLEGDRFIISTASGQTHSARAVVLATGGMSYQRMGTTGDGYRFAETLGHTIVTPRPAIVGLLIDDAWAKALQGTPVRDVEVRIEVSGPLPRLATGKPTPSVNDLLFTHFGLSGPAVLNVSEIVAELLEKLPAVTLRIDFARRHSHEALGALLRDWQQTHGRKMLRTMLAQRGPEVTIQATSPDQTWAWESKAPAKAPGSARGSDVAPAHMVAQPPGRAGGFSSVGGFADVSLGDAPLQLPSRLVDALLEIESIPRDLACSRLTSKQMHGLIQRLKVTRFAVTGTRGFKEAMVTAGGIALAEVDPQTLASKRVPGLYVTGEVLDLTGPSGGYNLQLAFSTGHLAGTSAADALGNFSGRAAFADDGSTRLELFAAALHISCYATADHVPAAGDGRCGLHLCRAGQGPAPARSRHALGDGHNVRQHHCGPAVAALPVRGV